MRTSWIVRGSRRRIVHCCGLDGRTEAEVVAAGADAGLELLELAGMPPHPVLQRLQVFREIALLGEREL